MKLGGVAVLMPGSLGLALGGVWGVLGKLRHRGVGGRLGSKHQSLESVFLGVWGLDVTLGCWLSPAAHCPLSTCCPLYARCPLTAFYPLTARCPPGTCCPQNTLLCHQTHGCPLGQLLSLPTRAVP